LAGPLVLKERTSRLMWLGIALAIAGSAVIGLADLSNPYGGTGWGNLLALAGAWFAAGYLLIGRSVRDQLPFVAYVWIVYGTAAVLLMAWVALRGLPLAGYSLRAMGLMIALGLIPQLIGHTAANYAVRHLSATLVSIAVLGEPVGSTILAVFLLGEQPGLLQILGGILILAGIVFASQVEGIKEKLP
jgi:drug/metabolite transporter (DMT)-like permease